jgi:hypothetical protein
MQKRSEREMSVVTVCVIEGELGESAGSFPGTRVIG